MKKVKVEQVAEVVTTIEREIALPFYYRETLYGTTDRFNMIYESSDGLRYHQVTHYRPSDTYVFIEALRFGKLPDTYLEETASEATAGEFIDALLKVNAKIAEISQKIGEACDGK